MTQSNPDIADDEQLLLDQFRNNLEDNPGISVNDYDRQHLKPSRRGLEKRFGVSWNDLKRLAYGEDISQEDVKGTTQYLVRQTDRMRQQLERQQNLNQIFIENCLAEILKCSFAPAAVPPPEKSKEDQDFHSLNSDDHCGDSVDAAWVQGVNSYNGDEFVKRRYRWAERVCTFREQDKKSLGLNRLVLWMCGDHVTGETVYKGQQFFTDLTVVEQLLLCTNTWVDILLLLASAFPQIDMYCVQGNHGRYGKKGEAHPKSNFDYLFFRMLQMLMAHKQANVNIYVSDCPTMLVQQGRFVFALNHNDDVKGWNGIPYYGLDRKARRLGDLYNMRIHYKLGGHFHAPANLFDETILNGTVKGGDELSVNKMRVATRPSQKIWYFDKEKGINRESNLYLAESPQLVADEHGIYTAHTDVEAVEIQFNGAA